MAPTPFSGPTRHPGSDFAAGNAAAYASGGYAAARRQPDRRAGQGGPNLCFHRKPAYTSLMSIVYEQLLDRDLDSAMREGSMHFEEKSAVHATLRRIAAKFAKLWRSVHPDAAEG